MTDMNFCKFMLSCDPHALWAMILLVAGVLLLSFFGICISDNSFYKSLEEEDDNMTDQKEQD